MQSDLLRTKLRVPPLRPGAVPRPRLIERLNQGINRRLTVISAPPGFGKTTLLTEWIAQSKHSIAWVSLDTGDNDPARFLAFLIAALQSLQSGIGATSSALLQSPQPSPLESVVSALISELDSFPEPFSLVLDDYHLIDAKEVHGALGYLLEHLPPPMHLLLSSRADPPLPLSRLRARDDLMELRAADLRFTIEEATAFLNQTMRIQLTPEEIAALDTRTEGWAAGLQMAALSMLGRDDHAGFIAAFAGTHRFILDYLTEEVLQQQQDTLRSFMLQTCILRRLSGPLCDAVTGQARERSQSGQALLEQLERANLFLMPLDDERRWYRYHPLFADLLQSRLRELQPERVSELHRRAADWYERNGFMDEAVEHLLAARDFEGAARLVEQIAPTHVLRGELSTVLGWVAALPEQVVRRRLVLRLAHAWGLVFTDQLDAAQERVEEMERDLGTSLDTNPTERAEVNALQSAIASGWRDTERTIELSRQALQQLPKNHPYRSVFALNLGFAYRETGDAALAEQAFAEAVTIGQATSNLMITMIAKTNVAHLHAARGHLRRAHDLYREALDWAANRGGASLPITGVALVGIGGLLCEWNRLEEAADMLRVGIERSQQIGSYFVDMFGLLRLAQLRRAQGDMAGALEVVRQAERRLETNSPLSWQLQFDALRAQLRLAHDARANEPDPWATEWAAAQQTERHAVNKPWGARAVEQLTLARVWIGLGKGGEALELLESLRQAIEAKGRTGNVIEVLMLEALALNARGDAPSAIARLETAIKLAEPEGFVRLFVNEGEPMREMLWKMKGRRVEGSSPHDLYIEKLLDAFGEKRKPGPQLSSYQSSNPQPLPDPLTERELQVLRLMAAGISNRGIADKFVVSINTVKTQVKSIYGKLGVHSRDEALATARAHHLL